MKRMRIKIQSDFHTWSFTQPSFSWRPNQVIRSKNDTRKLHVHSFYRLHLARRGRQGEWNRISCSIIESRPFFLSISDSNENPP